MFHIVMVLHAFIMSHNVVMSRFMVMFHFYCGNLPLRWIFKFIGDVPLLVIFNIVMMFHSVARPA